MKSSGWVYGQFEVFGCHLHSVTGLRGISKIPYKAFEFGIQVTFNHVTFVSETVGLSSSL